MPSRQNRAVEIAFNGEKRVVFAEISRRRNSRNLVLRVKNPENVSVSAPYGVSVGEIENFIKSCAEKILKTPPEENCSLEEYFSRFPEICLENETPYAVRLFDAKSGDFFIKNDKTREVLLAYDFSDKNGLKNLFINFAKTEIPKIVTEIAQNRGFLKIPPICVRDQQSRWASRSSSGKMSYNWRLLLIKPIFQKYIVCHEFAHEKFMDHSVSFWIYLNRIFDGAKKIDKLISKETAAAFKCAR